MKEQFQSIFNSLGKIKDLFFKYTIKHAILLFGNENAGKSTLMHYIMGADIVFELDDEGQDVLRVKDERKTALEVDNILSIVIDEQEQTMYIKMIGFPAKAKSKEENINWSIALDYILYLLASFEQGEVKISFIFVFSLQQLQEDDELLIKYKYALQNVPNFEDRTHIVLSRLVQQDEFHEFVDITVINFQEEKPQCEYISKIIEKKQIHGFYSRDVKIEEQNQLKQRIYNAELNEKLQTSRIGGLFKKCFEEDELSSIYNELNEEFKTCIELINCSLVQILLIAFDAAQNSKVSEHFQKQWQKIYNEARKFQANPEIKQKNNQKKLLEMYEKFRNSINQDHKSFQIVLFSYINVIYRFWDQELAQLGLLARSEILRLICVQISSKDYEHIIDDIHNIFGHQSAGFLDDQFILKIFQQCKPFLSAQLTKYLEDRATSSPRSKKKMLKKVKPKKNLIPRYNDQKNLYFSKERSISQILDLPLSPLKLDLLIQELNKRRALKSRDIQEEKSIIKSIVNILSKYRRFEEAARFSWVIPSTLDLYEYILRLLKEYKNKKSDISNEVSLFIEQAYNFLHLLRRQQMKDGIKFEIEDLDNGRIDLKSLKNKLNQIDKKVTNSKFDDNEKTLLRECYMNYKVVESIFTDKKSLIDKCIEFEYQNMGYIQRVIIEEWIMKGKEFKIVS